MDKTILAGGAVVFGLFVAIGVVVSRNTNSTSGMPTDRATPLTTAAEPAPQPAVVAAGPTAPSAGVPRAAVSAVPTVPAAVSTSVPDEARQMAELRELWHRDPLSAVKLARDGMNRDPNHPNAAERHWILIRALTDLRRSDEAREEARAMVQRYRGTDWASDVERHVLTHPPSPNPAERGE